MGKRGNKKRKQMIPVKSVKEMDAIRILKELSKRDNLRTPDFLDLKGEALQYVFVYGTLKTGGRLTGYLDDCPFLGEGTTALSSFEMKVSTPGKFPIMFDTKQPAKGHRVAGEVYVVDAKKMLELDCVERNGEMYVRQQRWIWLEDQKGVQGKPNLKPCERCWVYEGNPAYWQGREVTEVKPTKYAGGSLLLFDTKEKEHPMEKVPFFNPANQYPEQDAFLRNWELDDNIPWDA
jgi:gamma-glutamylcyclotransferase (GGCT)/AIG2-like uncharacterized protein YtfP